MIGIDTIFYAVEMMNIMEGDYRFCMLNESAFVQFLYFMFYFTTYYLKLGKIFVLMRFIGVICSNVFVNVFMFTNIMIP